MSDGQAAEEDARGLDGPWGPSEGVEANLEDQDMTPEEYRDRRWQDQQEAERAADLTEFHVEPALGDRGRQGANPGERAPPGERAGNDRHLTNSLMPPPNADPGLRADRPLSPEPEATTGERNAPGAGPFPRTTGPDGPGPAALRQV